ncbi:hypothetical protein OROMI_004695 [Orobanche minor]
MENDMMKMSEEGPVLNQIMPHRHKILYLRLMNELNEEEHQGHVGNFIKTFTGLEPQYAIESCFFQVYSGSGTAAPKCTSEARRKRSREKAYAADRILLRISYWLDALKERVPHPEKDEINGGQMESQMEAKVNKMVQENMTWFLKKLGEANHTLKFDIGEFCATFSSDQDETGTPITQTPEGATS